MVRYLIVPIAWILPAHLTGQALEGRIAAVGSGTVHMSFAARSGVCGQGPGNISTRQESDEWEAGCENQPVRVALVVRDRQVMAIRTYVGGRWRNSTPASDLGQVRPREAAAFFIKLAGQPRDLNGDPVLPATLADSVTIWPSLLQLARSSGLPQERRRNAIFWLGQAAGAAAASALDSIAVDIHGDWEVRKQAVFALSQRTPDEGVPALIRIARSNRDPELRKTALFWLGQSEDPRALTLFEEILR